MPVSWKVESTIRRRWSASLRPWLSALSLILFVHPALASECRGRTGHGREVCRPNTSTAPVSSPSPPVLTNPGTFTSTRFLGGGSVMRNMTFAGLGAIARPRGLSPDVTIEDVRTTGAANLIRTYTYADVLPNVTVHRIDMEENGAGGFIFRGTSSGTITDVRIIATEPNTDCHKVPEGIALAGKGSGDTGGPWTITRIHIEGIRSIGCSFNNGDGIAVERGYHDGTISDAYSAFNSDAGYDIKSPTFSLDRVVSDHNRRNYKFWADQTHGTITSIEPGQPGSGAPAHVQLLGSPSTIRTLHLAHLIARSSNLTPVFVIENGPWIVTVDSCELHLPAGTPLLVGSATLHLGPGCAL